MKAKLVLKDASIKALMNMKETTWKEVKTIVSCRYVYSIKKEPLDIDVVLVGHLQPLLPEQVWVTTGRFVFTMQEKEMILQQKIK